MVPQIEPLFKSVEIQCQKWVSVPYLRRLTQGLLRVAQGYILPPLRGSEVAKCVALCGW